MNIQDYIKPELLVLIPTLNIVGVAIKKMSINNKFIPLILGVAGVLLTALYVLSQSTMWTPRDISLAVFTSVVQGILCAGTSVYCNQLFKQAKE